MFQQIYLLCRVAPRPCPPGILSYEKKVPDEWINAEGNDVTEEMLNYLRPLVRGDVSFATQNGVPVHLSLYSEGK